MPQSNQFDSLTELVRAVQARSLPEGRQLLEQYGKAVRNRLLLQLRRRIYERTEPRPELLPVQTCEALIWVLEQLSQLEKLADNPDEDQNG